MTDTRVVSLVPRRWMAPAVVGAGALAGCAVVLVFDPRASDSIYVPCPFLAVTGYQCPLCGGLRAVRSLLALDLGAAVGYNAAVVLAVPALVGAWLAWFCVATGRRPPRRVTTQQKVWLTVSVMLFFALFTFVRNTGFDLPAPLA